MTAPSRARRLGILGAHPDSPPRATNRQVFVRLTVLFVVSTPNAFLLLNLVRTVTVPRRALRVGTMPERTRSRIGGCSLARERDYSARIPSAGCVMPMPSS